MDKAATIGNCIAKELNLVLRNPGEIPRMAEIRMEFRLNSGTQQSEWLPKGTFFIDTRDESKSGFFEVYLSGKVEDALYKSRLCTKMHLWPGFSAQVFRDWADNRLNR